LENSLCGFAQVQSESRHVCREEAAPKALHGSKALRGSKGIFSFAKENIPFGTPRERLCIVRLQLEELHALRNQVPA
jgi:hypothetical protein